MSKIILKLSPNEIIRAECILAAKGTESIQSVKNRTGADIVFNWPIYDFSGATIRSRFCVFGDKFGDYSSWGIGFDVTGKPFWDYDGQSKNAVCFAGAYTYLIRDGKITDTAGDPTKNGRTAMGLDRDGNLIVLVVDKNSKDSLGTTALAQEMLKLGCVNAINGDGSYSSQIITPTDKIVTTRNVAGYIGIWLKDKSSVDNNNNNSNNNENSQVKDENKMAYDVCLDPGHGKNTSGKSSPDGTYKEYEFARDIMRRIKAHLERCGLSVYCTVTDDTDVDLATRCKRANDSKAKIVVSLHSNAVGSGWNNANYFLQCITAKGGKAEKLGWAIEEEFLKVFPNVRSNGVQVQNLAIVRDTDAPAVLIEHGFHTNKDWLNNVLKTNDGRAKLAEIDAKGICRHLGVTWVEEKKEDNNMSNSNVSNTGKWYDKELTEAMQMGITDGTRPDDKCTRAEAAVMILRAIKNLK